MIIHMQDYKDEKAKDLRWEKVKDHYEAAYKKMGFKFKDRPSEDVILDLYKKVMRLAESERLQKEKLNRRDLPNTTANPTTIPSI